MLFICTAADEPHIYLRIGLFPGCPVLRLNKRGYATKKCAFGAFFLFMKLPGSKILFLLL